MNKDKKVISIIVTIVILALAVFLVVRNKQKNIEPSNLDDQLVGQLQDQVNEPALQTTSAKSDTVVAGYSFTPYTSSKLTLQGPVSLTAKERLSVENRMKDHQKTVDAFNADTPRTDKVNALFVLSADYQILGQYDMAKKTLEQAIVVKPDDGLLQTYASLLVNMGDANGGLKYINDAVKLNPANANAWRTKIGIERQLNPGNLASLDKVFKEAITKTDNDIDIIVLYANYLTEMKRISDAIVQWKKAIAVYPAKKDAYQQEIDILIKK